jgi:hypothetical protein
MHTNVAIHLRGDNLYFGHSTAHGLLGTETVTGLLAMAATGRRPLPEERIMLDAIAVAGCSADPRIWPLKLTRLVSSYGGTLAGLSAGQLALEGKQIGPWVIGHAAGELVTLRERIGDRFEVAAAVEEAAREHAAKRPRISGYGVPVRERDERLEALRGAVLKLGRQTLPYWSLQEALSTAVMRQWGAHPNVAIGIAAVLLDLGYTPLQASAVTTFVNQNVFAANAFEAAQQREPLMQKLPDECVSYVGPPLRASPRSRGQ